MAKDEDAFVARHRTLIVDGPRERMTASWKRSRSIWSRTPLAVKIVFVLLVLLLPSLCLYMFNNALAAPVKDQRFAMGCFVVLFAILILLWAASDASVTPWVAVQLAVIGGTL